VGLYGGGWRPLFFVCYERFIESFTRLFIKKQTNKQKHWLTETILNKLHGFNQSIKIKVRPKVNKLNGSSTPGFTYGS